MIGIQITDSKTQEENIVMAKKSVWALCFVALLAVAFALPASAQDSQDRGVSVRATEIHVVNAPEIRPPSTIFMNFGTYVAANCPNANAGAAAYQQCSWVPSGWLVCGATAAAPCTGQENVAVPFTPKVAATMHHVEIPVQTDVGTATYTASVQADSAGVPSGTYLQHVHTHTTAAFWACCGTGAAGGQVVAMTQALTAATQYWIVVDTNNAADTATGNVWAWSGFQPLDAYCAQTTACTTTYTAAFSNETPAVKVY
jgi:hypothetical protein